jgi:hypothetical protein
MVEGSLRWRGSKSVGESGTRTCKRTHIWPDVVVGVITLVVIGAGILIEVVVEGSADDVSSLTTRELASAMFIELALWDSLGLLVKEKVRLVA